MGETRSCSNCGLRYLKDEINCPHCGQENWAEMKRQDEARKKPKSKKLFPAEPVRDVRDLHPEWAREQKPDSRPESENLDLFPGNRR